MLQNATPLRKSAPGPPNSSDELVSCTAPATENAWILFKNPPRLPSFLEMLQNLHVLLTFDKIAIPRACHAKRHLNVKKVLRTPQFFFALLTSKCASRHNSVHFFDISTSKTGPKMVCFAHFDFGMCFAPQQCALFRHLNFKKCSEHGVLCAFWLRNVLRATTVCTYSTSQLQKVLQTWVVFRFFTCKCASCHNGVQFFIFHLASWLRTRRFSEPTFRPSGATNHWKNIEFRDFPTFSCTWIFLWLFLFYHLLFSLPFPISAFHLSILSGVWLLNFLRYIICLHLYLQLIN